MEIDKILFGQIAETKGIEATFEDLDVNNDGKITSVDIELAHNNELKKNLMCILGEEDTENDIVLLDEIEGLSSLSKAGAKNNNALAEDEIYDTTREQSAKDGIPVTDKANFEQDILNSSGVTYLIMGNIGGCSLCNELEEVLAEFKDELKDVANFYNMSWYENLDFCRDLAYNQAGVRVPAGFPCVLKFYNGKLVSTQYSGYGNVGRENINATASWAGTAFSTGYSYIDENGNNRDCKEYNYETRKAEWTHEPMLIDIIKKDVENTKKDPTVMRATNGQMVTTTQRFNDDVKSSKGTTYVVMGSPQELGGEGCQYCSYLTKQLEENSEKLEKVANVFSLLWDNDKDADLCRKIAYEMGNLQKPATFPVIAKFVDGEFVGIVPDTSGNNVYNNQIIQKLLDMAEGTPMTKYQYENQYGSEKASGTPDTTEETSELEKSAAEKSEKTKVQMQEIRNKLQEKELMYFQINNKIEAIQDEYEAQKAKFDKSEDSQKSFYKSSMETLQSQGKIYQMQAEFLQSEINQLSLDYAKLAAQLKS